MRIKGAKDSYSLILCKMNGKRMGMIPCEIVEIKRGIKTVSEITFTVNKYYGEDNKLNILYDELKDERIIELGKDECYVIKNIVETNETIKTVTAYSREKKLFKNSAEFEDITLTLKTPYTDIEGCFSLDELLYDETGWHIRYVSESVLYKSETIFDESTGEFKTSIKKPYEEKLRYQESVSTNWYDFIDKDISEQFECFPVFNSYSKTIDLYSDEELGNIDIDENGNKIEKIQKPELMLSYDNYLKSIEVTSNTEEIITRLKLSGNEDLTISEINPSGETFIEDFSFFIDSREMSDELISALELYYIMVKKRAVDWNRLRTSKNTKESEMTAMKTELLIVYSKIKAFEFAIEQSSDEAFDAKQQEELNILNDKRVILERDINNLNDEIILLQKSIENINKLCKKKYATDDNGALIFNENLLNELKDFIYQDSYSNDAITEAPTLMQVGTTQLKRRCIPTKSWSVDSVNFVEHLIDNGFRQQWNGELGLGDMIVLKGNESLEIIYLIGYTQNFKDKTIQLELSNKKDESDFSLTIGERLTQGKEAYRIAKKSRSTINMVNKNRYGLTYDKINKKIL